MTTPATRALRVGIVCPYSYDVPGGVQFHVRDLAEALLARGHAVEVLAPADDDTPVPDYLTAAGRAVPVRYHGSVARLTFGPVTAARTRKWLEQGRFDLDRHRHPPSDPGRGYQPGDPGPASRSPPSVAGCRSSAGMAKPAAASAPVTWVGSMGPSSRGWASSSSPSLAAASVTTARSGGTSPAMRNAGASPSHSPTGPAIPPCASTVGSRRRTSAADTRCTST